VWNYSELQGTKHQRPDWNLPGGFDIVRLPLSIQYRICVYINCIQTFSEISVSLLPGVQTTHIYINQLIRSRTYTTHTRTHMGGPDHMATRCILQRAPEKPYENSSPQLSITILWALSANCSSRFYNNNNNNNMFYWLYSCYLPILQCGTQLERHESGIDRDCSGAGSIYYYYIDQ